MPRLNPAQINKTAAFGLVEVLIAAVILSIALLGLASLQSRAIQSLQEGDNLVTASMLAEEMSRRMLSNPYVTAQGRQGYLQTDINGDIASAGSVAAWASATLSGSPGITRCYNADDTESCFASGASLSNSSDHIDALNNMQLIDQVEMRMLTAALLPKGELMICFDASGSTTTWACDNTATRIDARSENVYTIKVRWNNLFTNSTKMYTMQFTANCTDGSSTYCGN